MHHLLILPLLLLAACATTGPQPARIPDQKEKAWQRSNGVALIAAKPYTASIGWLVVSTPIKSLSLDKVSAPWMPTWKWGAYRLVGMSGLALNPELNTRR